MRKIHTRTRLTLSPRIHANCFFFKFSNLNSRRAKDLPKNTQCRRKQASAEWSHYRISTYNQKLKLHFYTIKTVLRATCITDAKPGFFLWSIKVSFKSKSVHALNIAIIVDKDTDRAQNTGSKQKWLIWVVARINCFLHAGRQYVTYQKIKVRGGSRGRVQGVRIPPPPWDYLRFSNTTGILQKKKKTMWFIGVEVEQKTSAPPPKKNLGSAPEGSVMIPTQRSVIARFR